MKLARTILKMMGWKTVVSVPDYPKSLVCVAPHTSNWDFIIGELAYRSVGRDAGFLMKDTWFFWPLGPIFRSLGGIPVPRKKPGKGSLTEFLVNKFKTSDRLTLAITPEGTRSRTSQWRTGFLHIALQANIPIVLAVIDYQSKVAMLAETFIPTGDIEADMRAIKDFYRPYAGKYPEKFCAE